MRVLRFTNLEILQETEGVIARIWDALTPALSQGERENELPPALSRGERENETQPGPPPGGAGAVMRR